MFNFVFVNHLSWILTSSFNQIVWRNFGHRVKGQLNKHHTGVEVAFLAQDIHKTSNLRNLTWFKEYLVKRRSTNNRNISLLKGFGPIVSSEAATSLLQKVSTETNNTYPLVLIPAHQDKLGIGRPFFPLQCRYPV